MTGGNASGRNSFQDLYAQEALRGEILCHRIRWAFLVLAGGLSLAMWFMDRYRPVVYPSVLFLLVVTFYNHLLGRSLRRGILPRWLRYVPTTLDILFITLYNYLISVYIAPFGVVTIATLFIYPIILFYVSLRLDGKLLLYALALVLVCFNLAYFLRLPHLDQSLIRQVVSADITGQVFKSIFLGCFGLSLFYLHRTVRRLVEQQAQAHQEQQAAEERHRTTLEAQVQERTQDLTLANQELRQALAEVKTLSGLLPICAHCKKIRDDSGYWQAVEKYIVAHSDARFSHGVCPDCVREHYPEYSDILDDAAPAPAKKG